MTISWFWCVWYLHLQQHHSIHHCRSVLSPRTPPPKPCRSRTAHPARSAVDYNQLQLQTQAENNDLWSLFQPFIDFCVFGVWGWAVVWRSRMSYSIAIFTLYYINSPHKEPGHLWKWYWPSLFWIIFALHGKSWLLCSMQDTSYE